MTRRVTQLGPLVEGWNRKYGYKEFPRPGGVNSQGSPSSLGPDQFAKLVNIRWNKDSLRPRAGYGRIMTDVLHDATAKLYPHHFNIATPFRAWYSAAGCPGESADNGTFTGFYDPETDPAIQRNVWYSTATGIAKVGYLGNTPYTGVEGSLRKVNLVQAPFGIDQIEVAGSSADIEINDWPGETIEVLMTFDGAIFVFLNAGTDHVATYDGLTVREDSTFPAVPVAAGLYRDLLVAGFDDGTVYWRPAGDSPGTWTLAGTAVAGIHPGLNSMVSHKDVLYIISGEDMIYSWDGTTFGTAHTIGGSENIQCLAEAFGYLFYGYYDSLVTEVHVGRFDASGPTWDDTHKRLTDDDVGVNLITAMTLYKNELLVIVRDAGTMKIGSTSAQATTGTWTFNALAANYGTQVPSFLVV